MARQFTGGNYQGADGVFHYPWADDVTGETGEELSYDPPTSPTFTAPLQGPAPGSYNWTPNAYTPTGQIAAAGPSLNQSLLAAAAGPNWGTPWFQPGGVATGTAANQAGTTGVPYGFGLINQGRERIAVDPSYLPFLQEQAAAGRFIPGSGSYLGWQLDKPGLLATIGGAPNQLTTWGSGAVGDPAGTGPRTPEQWVQGPKLFSWSGMMTGAQGPIASLFGRSDTPSGISTDVMNAPDPYWNELYAQIANGRVQPSAAGWQFLQSVRGVTPQTIGGAAPAQAQSVGTGAGQPSGGPGAPGGQPGGFGAGEYFNYQAGLLANAAAEVAYQRTYHEWLARNGDAQTAIQQAQQAATQAYQEAQVRLEEQRLGLSREELQQRTGIEAAQLMAQLRGPANAFAAARALYGLNQTTGVPNAVAALSGQYNVPGFQAPQALPQAATLQTLAQQLGAAGTGAGGDITRQAQEFAAALPAANQIVGRNFARLSPATQQLTLAGYESRGENPEDVLATIQAALPQFSAPAYGSVG